MATSSNGQKIENTSDTSSSQLELKLSNVPHIFIKKIAIQLRSNFSFDNLPHSQENNSKKPFIGRENLIEKFIQMLKKERGVYLVTGYRGMGKTSFVNQVIKRYNENVNSNDKFKSIKITITQNNPTETEILKLIVSTLRDECLNIYKISHLNNLQKRYSILWKVFAIVFISIFFLFLLGNAKNEFVNIFILEYPETIKNAIDSYSNKYTVFQFFKDVIYNNKRIADNLKLIMFTSFLFSLIFAFRFIHYKYYSKTLNLFRKLDNLYKRCHSNVSFEDSQSSELVFEAINAKFTDGGTKKIENYPIASSKEIEYELTNIINKL